MRKTSLLLFISLLLVTARTSIAQDRPPVREYTNPDERISMGGDTKFRHAMDIFGDMFKRFGGKVLVYEGNDQAPININVPHLYWRDAFEMVLRVNSYWFDERDAYVRIFKLELGAKGDSLGVASASMKSSREIEISAIFFETNATDLKQLGIDWSVLNTAPLIDEIGGKQTVLSIGSSGNASSVSDGGIGATVLAPYQAAKLSAAIKAITANNLGEIVASPSITVRSGEQGRIQVGSDVSIKQKDFAGNLIEQFFSTGTIIEVTPTMLSDDSIDFVHLKIAAERSSVLPDPNRTVIDRTKATTSVLLLDNEETVIGGLYTNEERSVRRGIPILKDLPWWFFGIRYLTGYEEAQLIKKELVIILRANIVPALRDRIQAKLADRERRELHDRLDQYQQMMKRINTQVDAQRKK